jgi:two-component system phosphate regulon sensor histidine kinase PhoR
VLGLRARLFGSIIAAAAIAIGAWWLVAPSGAIVWAALGSTATAALLTEWLARSIRGPIRDLTDATDALRRGDFKRRVRSNREDEIGALGGAIDRMADQLDERYHAIRREEARLRTILDAMVEAVLVTDAHGRIVMTNAALARLTKDSLEGLTPIEAIRSPALHEAVQSATRGNPSSLELEIGARSITAHVAPLPKRQGVVAVLHDVTDLKLADAVRRDFVANASHELRTPLTAIRGFAETLLDGAIEDERMSRRFVGNIAENSKRLHRIVEDLLALSRAESPESPIELGPIDVVLAAAHVLRGLTQQASQKRLQLILEGAGQKLEARAEARALDQVLLNLVENAVKYTPDGGRVSLAVRTNEGRVVIEVSDSGPGIPRKHLDRIFERFYRVDKGRARAQGGTGLGLSIVRHLVTRMEGEVSVASRVGKGSTFRVSLKLA